MKKSILIITLVALIFIFSGCSRKDDYAAGSAPGLGDEAEAYIVTEMEGFCLKYPGRWENSVEIQVGNNQVEYACSEGKLFAILFDSEDGNYVGTMKNGDKTVSVSIQDYLIENASEDVLEMQEDVNVILSNLRDDYGLSKMSENGGENFEVAVYKIDTEVVPLYYPEQWEDKITVDVSKEKVAFSSDGIKLFDISFVTADNAVELGSFQDTVIYLVPYEIDTTNAGVATEKLEELLSMQEDSNVIITHLKEEKGFVEKGKNG